MELKNLNIKSLFFLVIFVGLGFTLLRVFSPFFNVIVISLILTQLFHPVYNKIYKLSKSKILSSVLSTITTVTLVIIPMIIILLLSTAEIINITSQLGIGGDSLDQITTNITDLEAVVNEKLAPIYERFSLQPTEFSNIPSPITAELATNFKDVFSIVSNTVLDLAGAVLQSGISAIFYGVLLIITLIYMFMEYDNIPKLINQISPLDDELDKTLYKKFSSTSRAVIVGNFVVAIVQASVIIPILIMMGVGSPALLWIIMFIFSLIPVGSGVVWVPVGLFMIFTGNPIGGIMLLVYGAVALNLVEAIVRPFLLKDSVQLHPLIIIFSALGGIATFEAMGILYGPLLAVFYKSLMEIYADKYATNKQSNPTISQAEQATAVS